MIIFENKVDFNKNILEYKFQKSDIIDTFSEGMIKNNNLKGVLPISFQQIDNEKIYRYDISGCISLRDFLSKPVWKDDLINIFKNIISVFRLASEYMIEEEYFILDTNYIFVSDKNKEIKMVCLPLENIVQNIDISDFIRNILMSIKYQSSEDTGYVIEILNYVNSNSNYSLNDLMNMLGSISQAKSIEKVKVQQAEKKKPIIEPEKTVIKREQVRIPVQDTQQKSVVPPIVKPLEVEPKVIKIEENNKKSRKDGIPTLRKRFSKRDDETEPKVEQPIKKKSIIPTLKGRKKDTEKEIKKRSSIPTLNKRKGVDITNVGQSGPINSNVTTTYAKDVMPRDFAGTTVLNEDEGTTVLSEGTTVLSENQFNTIKYPTLKRISTNEIKDVVKTVFTIGKDIRINDFIVNNSAVSRKHARIESDDGRYYIVDLNSTNKTIVDGTVVPPNYRVELFSGSRIKIADEDFIFEI